ncbi:MAG: TatD family hydrolase [Spirochaetales bacterium]|nr:TatD family hydrolase [Spirochaetales bacterium]
MEMPEIVPMLSDSHFHSLAMAGRGLDPVAILTELREKGAGPMLDVAIEPEDAPLMRESTGGIEEVYHSCGLHPGKTAREDREEALDRVERELGGGYYRAVGETGLDWFRMYAPRETQLTLFERHLDLAARFDLPVIVHNREADRDCLDRLVRAALPRGGVMHCFSSSPEWVTPFLDAGMYISFAGNLTFRNAAALREAVRLVPGDRLLLETDAPFLAPHPHRGRPNHPGLLSYTLGVAAELRGERAEDLARRAAVNLTRMLALTP